MAGNVRHRIVSTFPYRRDKQFPREISAMVNNVASGGSGGNTPTPTPTPVDSFWYKKQDGGDDFNPGVDLVTTDNDAFINNLNGSLIIDETRISTNRETNTIKIETIANVNSDSDTPVSDSKANLEVTGKVIIDSAEIEQKTVEQPVYAPAPKTSLFAKLKGKKKPASNGIIPALVLAVPQVVGNIIIKALRTYIDGDLAVTGNILGPLATETKMGVMRLQLTGSGNNVDAASITNGVLTIHRNNGGGGGIDVQIVNDGSFIVDADWDGSTLILQRGDITYTEIGGPASPDKIVAATSWVSETRTLTTTYIPKPATGMTEVLHDSTLTGKGILGDLLHVVGGGDIPVNFTTVNDDAVHNGVKSIDYSDYPNVVIHMGKVFTGIIYDPEDDPEGYVTDVIDMLDGTIKVVKSGTPPTPTAITFTPPQVELTHAGTPPPIMFSPAERTLTHGTTTYPIMFKPAELTLTHSITPPTPPTEFDVTLTMDDGGSYTVGQGAYPAGATVTIQAFMKASRSFFKWCTTMGATISLDNPYTFTMPSSPVNWVAISVPPPTYNVALSGDAGIAILNGDGGYIMGTSVTVSAGVKNGYTFDGWYENGEKVAFNTPYTFTMPAQDRILEAHTAPDMFAVNLQKDSGIALLYGGGAHAFMSEVYIHCTLQPGYVFQGWYNLAGELVYAGNDYIFTMPDAEVILVAKSKRQYTLTLNKDAGINTVSGAGKYYEGQSVTIYATIKDGYTWAAWYMDGQPMLPSNVNTFTMPAQDLTFTATTQ